MWLELAMGVLFISVPVLIIVLLVRFLPKNFVKDSLSQYGGHHDEAARRDFYVYDDKDR